MKVFWDEDEWYPVFSITKFDPKWKDDYVEISDEEYQDYKRVMKEFDAWQKKIEGLSNRSQP